MIHQEEALTDCEIIEISAPHFNDRVRVEKKYGIKCEEGLPTTNYSEIIEKIICELNLEMEKNILILPHAQRLSFFYKVEENLKKKNNVFFFKGIKKLDNFSQDNENIFLPDFLTLKNKKITQSSSIKTEINNLEKKKSGRTPFTTMIHNERDLGNVLCFKKLHLSFFSNKFSF